MSWKSIKGTKRANDEGEGAGDVAPPTKKAKKTKKADVAAVAATDAPDIAEETK